MIEETLPNDEMDEAESFELLYKTHAPRVRSFLLWRTHDDMLADDLTSSVFEKAWRNRAKFVGGSAKAWLYAIARNTLTDYWRSRKPLPFSEADEVAEENLIADSSETLDSAMAFGAVRIALQQLPLDMRRVVELRFVEGKSCRAVAEALGLSEANVRVIQYRALQKLRRSLS